MVSKREIQEAKKVDLLTYLQTYEPDQLVRRGNNTYCTREHDSLIISNGLWHWFSHGIGGSTALDYLIKVQNLDFQNAVYTVLGKIADCPPQIVHQETHGKPVFQLPEPFETNDTAVRYLVKRGIDREIIDYCIDNHLLYESKPYHNVVFVGYDSDHAPRYAALRGTLNNYKGDAVGSDKHYSFSLFSQAPTDENMIHLFESAIDALSYATLLKKTGRCWRKNTLLSLAGVYKTTRFPVIPLALQQYLKEHPSVYAILLHLDNDEIGRAAAEGIIQGLGETCRALNCPPPYCKDVNDYLQEYLRREAAEKSLQKARER